MAEPVRTHVQGMRMHVGLCMLVHISVLTEWKGGVSFPVCCCC